MKRHNAQRTQQCPDITQREQTPCEGVHSGNQTTIADKQNQGWRLNTYQATGYGAEVKHYLLFEKGD